MTFLKDNNQHDDNADKQFVMISSLFDRLVFAFQSHVDAFEWISSGRRTQICLRRCSGPRHQTHQNQESTMTSSFDSDPSATPPQEALSAGNASGKIDWRQKDCVFIRFSILCMNLFRYSGAGDELISPVYIAPTLPPFVERTWPEDEVTIWLHICICDGQRKY